MKKRAINLAEQVLYSGSGAIWRSVVRQNRSFTTPGDIREAIQVYSLRDSSLHFLPRSRVPSTIKLTRKTTVSLGIPVMIVQC